MNGTVFRDHCEAESHAEGPQWSARQGRRRVCSCCGSRLGPAWCVCERGACACARRSLSLHRQDLTTSGSWRWPSGQAPVTGGAGGVQRVAQETRSSRGRSREALTTRAVGQQRAVWAPNVHPGPRPHVPRGHGSCRGRQARGCAAGARHAGVPPVCHRCARGATRRSVAQGSSAQHGRTARGRPLSACTTHFTPCDMATLCGSPRHRRSSGGRRVRWPLSLGGCTLMPMARWRRAWGTATRTLAPQDRGQGSDHVGRCRREASERPGRHRPAWRCTGTP